MALSDLVARRAKATGTAYTLKDFDGLSLFVSDKGLRSWHFRYVHAGRRARMSFGTYPTVTLAEARSLRDEARALVAKGLNPKSERDRKRQATVLAGEHTFMAVYEQWRDHRKLSLEEGRQTSLAQIKRVFTKDVFPKLRHLTIHEITRAHLLDIIGRVEKRGSLSVAEKLRSWFGQLFAYARVVVPGMSENPATELAVVAVPLPPVNHHPFLRMPELPAMLRTLRTYGGRLNTQLAVRLLLLTGVRTGELRFATPDQFDLDRGLWIIPVARLKQRNLLTRKKRKRLIDVPPYIVPLSVQAKEIVRHLLDRFAPAQVYLLPGARCIKHPISENTLNGALKRLGYQDRLTGHGLRATMSTALNEIGYPKNWVDAQLSHADPNRISATYNHAEYVEQRRVMMQDWADRLDLFEQDQVEAASMHLTIHLQGLPTVASASPADAPGMRPHAPLLVVASTGQGTQTPVPTQRLPAVALPDYAKPVVGEIQQERLARLEVFKAPHNLRVAEYARLAGKSRRWISYEIQANNLLALHLGNQGQRVPDWQLDPLKRRLVQSVLRATVRSIDPWVIYEALAQPHPALGGRPPIAAVTIRNLERAAAVVGEVVNARAGHLVLGS